MSKPVYSLLIPEERETISQQQPSNAPESTDISPELSRALMCAEVCDEYRGQNIVVLDLCGVTPMFDYFVICTGTSERQMRALIDESHKRMKKKGISRAGIEGRNDAQWIVEDYGDVVLHVLTPDARTLYDLEGLWADGKQVDWQSLTGHPDAANNRTDEEMGDSANS